MLSAPDFIPAFRAAAPLAAAHYRDERFFLDALAPHEPAVVAKLAAQHAEVLEIAAAVEDSLATGQSDDARRLARRFQALAQHNIIEEERDVYPVAARCFEF